MKKISITGGSGLIGSEIVRHLSLDHQLVLVNERLPHVDEIINEIHDCDVFINNAMHKWGQVDLLMKLYDLWRTEDKLIVNIGSRAAAPNISIGYEYSTVKSSINHFSDLVRFKDDAKKCRVSTINPGLVGKIDGVSLTPSYIGEIVAWLVNQPKYVEISRIDVSHVAPYEQVQRMKKNTQKQSKE
ncbi:hypothetical protein FIT74_04340 [Candidatus Methylopumilus universalis]|uniref:NAD-dependent epimerase/dehydratase family protein n=1 Tax=Candidatus Methylopumilus universalis TaxID=2588536 RepID=A0ABX5VTT7_9PROT|nr:hypothetical protein [Candidatus Methylopumilus universalis]QDC51250.1 hypothetical protein FIT73_04290 [Candidatus Methylopumilus universalis]QDC61388.1 hypothetical protein FIT74_04340 [Candidatus Methylopumilus universalis]